MKLDIHVHTKKVKSGDATTRNIEKDRFVDILKRYRCKDFSYHESQSF